MKKYHLFAGINEYPAYGMRNYGGCFDTLEKAETEGEKAKKDGFDWYHIATTDEDGKLICVVRAE